MLHEIKLSTAECGPPSPPHLCGGHRRCLGPLAFHTGSAGSQISLSLGGRRAERARGTFQNGVVFSSRPVKVRERIRLRVEVWDQHWEGALRLGFTAVPPVWASPAAMAIPHLTDKPGYWAGVVPDSLAPLGSELCFWVDPQGRVILENSSGQTGVLQEGVDVRRKLWAMIDVYGQTRAVLLLGSEKKGKFGIRRSCPTPPPPPVSRGDSCLCVPKGRTFHVHRSTASLPQQQQLPDTAPPTGVHLEEDCSVCLSLRASVTLSCGHRCLCTPCATRVAEEFGSCPLCRQPIIGFCDVHEG
ncbi:E3 ubiquitin-protein ligase NEURL3-like [Anguilla rostrata]|uniref:E3 ubiquitin-protein ligase NEURL3-like n=1 Tax=Anguilla rostrata TaxID=7938 RepID=UPI0030D51069